MKAIYPGTFDPPTWGHLNIALRSLKFCPQLIVAIGINPLKNCLFTPHERAAMWKKILNHPHVEIMTFQGLLVDFVKQQQATFIIKAIRDFIDFEQESQQAYMNHVLSGIETIYLPADERYRLISSSLIKEVGKAGKSLDAFIPQEIRDDVINKLITDFNR